MKMNNSNLIKGCIVFYIAPYCSIICIPTDHTNISARFIKCIGESLREIGTTLASGWDGDGMEGHQMNNKKNTYKNFVLRLKYEGENVCIPLNVQLWGGKHSILKKLCIKDKREIDRVVKRLGMTTIKENALTHKVHLLTFDKKKVFLVHPVYLKQN